MGLLSITGVLGTYIGLNVLNNKKRKEEKKALLKNYSLSQE
jgi:hypothetical protein